MQCNNAHLFYYVMNDDVLYKFTPLVHPTFNILVRCTQYSTQCGLCIKSVLGQSYSNINIIIGYTDDQCLEYLREYQDRKNITVQESTESNILQDMMNHVKTGWIIILDDFSTLENDMVLNTIRHEISTNNDVLFWKVKTGRRLIFPRDIHHIERRSVSMSGFCFHAKHKHFGTGVDTIHEGYEYISQLLSNATCYRSFIDKVLVSHHSYGKREESREFSDYIVSQNIQQIYISDGLEHTKERLLNKYNLRDYWNKTEPCIFFGVYNNRDIQHIRRHEGEVHIMPGGPEVGRIASDHQGPAYDHQGPAYDRQGPAYDRQGPAYDRQGHIYVSISDDIDSRFAKHDIPSVRVNFSLVDTELFTPTYNKGSKIIIYDGIDENDKNVNIYGKMYYDEVMKRMPEYDYIFTSRLQAPYEMMPAIYANCSLGVRLTSQDGNANMVQELEAMNIPVVHNHSDYGLKWKTVEDVMKHIADNTVHPRIIPITHKIDVVDIVHDNFEHFNRFLERFKNILFICEGRNDFCNIMQKYYNKKGHATFSFHFPGEKMDDAIYEDIDKLDDSIYEDTDKITSIDFKPNCIIFLSQFPYDVNKHFQCPTIYLWGGTISNIEDSAIRQMKYSTYTFVNSKKEQDMLLHEYGVHTYLFFSKLMVSNAITL